MYIKDRIGRELHVCITVYAIALNINIRITLYCNHDLNDDYDLSSDLLG